MTIVQPLEGGSEKKGKAFENGLSYIGVMDDCLKWR